MTTPTRPRLRRSPPIVVTLLGLILFLPLLRALLNHYLGGENGVFGADDATFYLGAIGAAITSIGGWKLGADILAKRAQGGSDKDEAAEAQASAAVANAAIALVAPLERRIQALEKAALADKRAREESNRKLDETLASLGRIEDLLSISPPNVEEARNEAGRHRTRRSSSSTHAA